MFSFACIHIHTHTHTHTHSHTETTKKKTSKNGMKLNCNQPMPRKKPQIVKRIINVCFLCWWDDPANATCNLAIKTQYKHILPK